jgi:hypothetical protein
MGEFWIIELVKDGIALMLAHGGLGTEVPKGVAGAVIFDEMYV